jgi:hypothetical protein
MKTRNIVSSTLLAAAAVVAFSAGPALAQGRPASSPLPYATSFVITLANGTGTNGFSPDIVPATKRLIVEFVSVTVVSQPGDKPALYLNDLVNGGGRAYWIPLTMVETAASGAEVWRATQLVKLNHDGNGANGPGAQCSRGVNSSVPMTCQLTVSGTLVDK